MTKRIIIVEDNRPVREGFASLIAGSGRYVVAGQYDNCEEAIRHLERDEPDVVLMDIDLPGMSGIEGTSRIKKHCPTCIVLIITVYEDSERYSRASARVPAATSSKTRGWIRCCAASTKRWPAARP